MQPTRLKDLMLTSPTTRPFYPVGHMAHNIQEGMGDRTHLSRSNLLELDLSLCWFHDHRHLVLVWSHLTYTDQIKTVEGRFVTQPLKNNVVQVFSLGVSLLLLAKLAEPQVAF